MKKLLMSIKDYIEDREVLIDNEWGISSSLEDLIDHELMPALYYDLVAKIEEYK